MVTSNHLIYILYRFIRPANLRLLPMRHDLFDVEVYSFIVVYAEGVFLQDIYRKGYQLYRLYVNIQGRTWASIFCYVWFSQNILIWFIKYHGKKKSNNLANWWIKTQFTVQNIFVSTYKWTPMAVLLLIVLSVIQPWTVSYFYENWLIKYIYQTNQLVTEFLYSLLT